MDTVQQATWHHKHYLGTTTQEFLQINFVDSYLQYQLFLNSILHEFSSKRWLQSCVCSTCTVSGASFGFVSLIELNCNNSRFFCLLLELQRCWGINLKIYSMSSVTTSSILMIWNIWWKAISKVCAYFLLIVIDICMYNIEKRYKKERLQSSKSINGSQ